jgi:sortase A
MKWGERILMLVGFGFMVWCGGIVLQTHLFQARLKAHLANIPKTNWDSHSTLPRPRSHSDFMGQIDIPRIGLTAVILEGSDDRSLRLGVGHISGTAFPGEPGNVALAGHRDTFFRSLRKIRQNDDIRLTTLDNSSTYRVDWVKVVSPDDTEVLRSDNRSILTLITCYPFNFVGSAPKRFVVRAHHGPEATTIPGNASTMVADDSRPDL